MLARGRQSGILFLADLVFVVAAAPIAAGRAIEKSVGRTWVPLSPGNGAVQTETQNLSGNPPGAVQEGAGSLLGGYAPGMADVVLEGLGRIADVKAGHALLGGTVKPGLWVLSL